MITHIDGLKTYYEASGEGRPVVLLHGWGSDSSSLRPVLNLLRQQLPVRACALDFPGFGYSDGPAQPWDVSAYARFLLGFLDDQGFDQVDLVAHSFGGRVAIKLAAGSPGRVRRLVLVDSAGIRPRRTLGYRLRVTLAKALKRLRQASPRLAHALRLDRLAARQGSSDYQRSGSLRQTFIKVVNEDLSDLLPAISCPTLLVWGERDDSTPLSDGRLMQRLIPCARLEVLAGAGHYSYAERFPEFSKLLVNFLSEASA